MNKVFSLFVLLLGLSACTPPPDFHVSLTVSHMEESEDSNSQQETVEIDGYKGTYTWVYDGYHPDDDFDTDREYSFKLTEEELQELTLLIRENGLLVSRDDTVSTGEPWSAFDVSWDMSMDGQAASGHVAGEPISWEDWSSTGHDSFAEDESLSAGETVMNFIQDKVEFEY